MKLPTSEELEQLQAKSQLDGRTILLILQRQVVGPRARKRFQMAADDLGIKLARDFFALDVDDDRKPSDA